MFGLSGLQVLLISAVVSALLSGIGAGVIVHKVDKAALVQVKLDWATAAQRALAAAKAKQEEGETIAHAAGFAEGRAQQVIQVQNVTLMQEIPRYVTRNIPCVTVGLVRVLDAAATGVDIGAPRLSDKDCAGIEIDQLAQSIADNYATARANAEQLRALQQVLHAELDTQPPAARGIDHP